MATKPLGGHHPRGDLDNDTYVPAVARSLRATGNCKHREDSETYVMAHGQANAEIVSDGSPSLTCNHEAPICIQSVNMVRERKQNGIGDSNPGSPMYSLTGRDQHAIAFQSRISRNGHGTPQSVVHALGASTTGDSKPLTAGSFGVRRLTPTECLRLQGFSDDWFDGLGFSDSVKYRLIGNSVAIPCVEWIARRIAQHPPPPPPGLIRAPDGQPVCPG